MNDIEIIREALTKSYPTVLSRECALQDASNALSVIEAKIAAKDALIAKCEAVLKSGNKTYLGDQYVVCVNPDAVREALSAIVQHVAGEKDYCHAHWQQKTIDKEV